MGLPHEPFTRLEIEDYLSMADAFRDSYALMPRSDAVGRATALEAFRAFVADRYSRLKATLEECIDLRAALSATERVAVYAWHSVNCDFRHCAFKVDGGICDEGRAEHFAPHSHGFTPGKCSCDLAEARAALSALLAPNPSGEQEEVQNG